jgi:hypothetical protein
LARRSGGSDATQFDIVFAAAKSARATLRPHTLQLAAETRELVADALDRADELVQQAVTQRDADNNRAWHLLDGPSGEHHEAVKAELEGRLGSCRFALEAGLGTD